MKTILLHIHDDAEQESRLQVALDLARLDDGHISCVQITSVESRAVDPYGALFGLAAVIDTMRHQDKAARHAIEARLAEAAVRWDWRCFDGGVIETLIAQSRLADAVVVSQPGARAADQMLAIVGDLVVHTSAPVIVTPTGWRRFEPGANVILAWNGSAEAAHAMRLATPLLRHAACVHVVEVREDRRATHADAAAYLARHDIGCELHEWPAKGRRTSAALLHAVDELDARYIVMGAYGHSRLRETVLGGATRDLIQSTTVPLLLAH